MGGLVNGFVKHEAGEEWAAVLLSKTNGESQLLLGNFLPSSIFAFLDCTFREVSLSIAIFWFSFFVEEALRKLIDSMSPLVSFVWLSCITVLWRLHFGPNTLHEHRFTYIFTVSYVSLLENKNEYTVEYYRS